LVFGVFWPHPILFGSGWDVAFFWRCRSRAVLMKAGALKRYSKQIEDVSREKNFIIVFRSC
jgi:hypothetical protein